MFDFFRHFSSAFLQLDIVAVWPTGNFMQILFDYEMNEIAFFLTISIDNGALYLFSDGVYLRIPDLGILESFPEFLHSCKIHSGSFDDGNESSGKPLELWILLSHKRLNGRRGVFAFSEFSTYSSCSLIKDR